MPPVPPIVYDAQHWRDRADEARAMAEQSLISTPAMLEVAAGYDRLAERAAARKLALLPGEAAKLGTALEPGVFRH
jgi:hypothetical protein